ncbi:MAG: hypothetical protein WA981_17190 [Glaciecola sp.]
MPIALNHAFTPKALAEINSQLSSLLVDDDADEHALEKIIDIRADLVETLLNELDEQQKRCFAAYEININTAIIDQVSEKRDALRNELTTASKSSKAIKKYHQV